MAHLLDSDIVIDHLVDDPTAVRLVELLAPSGLAMSAVSYMEAYQVSIATLILPAETSHSRP